MSQKVGWQTLTTDTKPTDVETMVQTGGPRHARVGPSDRKFRWVKNATGGALVLGDVVFFGSNDKTIGEVYKVNQSGKGTHLGLMAGVVNSTNGIASGEYGWIQVKGYNPSINMESTTDIAAGDFLKGVNDQLYVIKSVAVGTAPTHVNGVVAVTAKTADSAGLNDGFICCDNY